MFHILAAVAEVEPSLISECMKAGIVAMRQKNGGSGAGPGRSCKLFTSKKIQLQKMCSKVNFVTGKSGQFEI